MAATSSLLNRRKEQEPKVSISRLSSKQLQDAHAKLTAMANPNPTGQGKAMEKGATAEETNTAITLSRQTRHSSHTAERTSCSRSSSTVRDMDGKGIGGKGSSTWTAPKTMDPKRRPIQKDSKAVSTTLLKAGGAAHLGKDVGSIPKRAPGKKYMVDYSMEPCPAPTYKVDQPSGSHLTGAPS